MIEIELSLLGAVNGPVTFSETILADIRGTFRTFGSRMSFLFADAADALENPGLCAIRLGMAVFEVVGLVNWSRNNIGPNIGPDSPFLTAVKAWTHLARRGAISFAVAVLREKCQLHEPYR